MVDELSMKWSEFEGKDNDIIQELKGLPNYDHIMKRWENASKMRSWINEKKSNLMERIKKEEEAELQKKKDEEIKKKEEEKQKVDEDAMQIDTSSKPKEAGPEEPTEFTEEEK